MPANFPTSLDTFPSASTLAGHTLGTDPHSTLHGNLGDALAALEAKVGVNGSLVTTSLDYLFAHLAEANLTLSDVLTGNVSITRHGFAPKAPNDATKFLNGVGAYSVPAGTPQALSGLTDVTLTALAQGHLLYYNGTAWVNLLPAGTPNNFLKSQGSGANPVWSTIGISQVSGAGLLASLNSLTEVYLNFSDNTTADVSISQHGLAPKSPNDATKFLNGLGAYSTPAGGSPGGSTGQVQYNSAGSFAGAAGVTYATSGSLLIARAQVDSDVPLVCKGHSGTQSGNLQQWQKSDGTVLAKIDAAGNLVITSSGIQCALDSSDYSRLNFRLSGTNKAAIGYDLSGSGNTSLGISGDGGGHWGVVVNANNQLIVDSQSNVPAAISTPNYTDLSLFLSASNHTGLVLKAAAGQSVDIQQWQDNNGTVLTEIQADGSVKCPFLGIGANSSGSVYVNTGTAHMSFYAGANNGIFLGMNTSGNNYHHVYDPGLAGAAGGVAIGGSGGQTTKPSSPVLLVNSNVPAVAFFGNGSFGSGAGVLFLATATTAPSTNPTGGFLIYLDPADNKLKARGPSGTVTTIANP